MHRRVFYPRILEVFKSYSGKQFTSDLMAGIIVGIVAIPLAIAFGIASGVGPTEGLITAVIAGFIVSVMGGTKVQIGGPTGAVWLVRVDDRNDDGRRNTRSYGCVPIGFCY